MTWLQCNGKDVHNANRNSYSWYLARLLGKLLSGSSTGRCLCWQSPITPTWCNSPRLVCDTNSAAPPIGLVTTPMSPLLMPDTRPVAVPDTVPPSAVCARVKTCSGWSAMPASAPTQSRQQTLWQAVAGFTVSHYLACKSFHSSSQAQAWLWRPLWIHC